MLHKQLQLQIGPSDDTGYQSLVTSKVFPPPRSPDARCAPPPARCLYPRPPRGLHSPCVLSPDP
eukprot:4527616-Prymnesium_polylepis.1